MSLVGSNISGDGKRAPRGATRPGPSPLAWPVAVAVALVAAAIAGSAFGAGQVPKGTIYFTGNVLGFLEQCGCKKAPLGGLDKRSGYIEQRLAEWPGAWRLTFDAGNFSDSPGPAGQVKTRGLVEAMNMLAYEAAGVGERDLMLGPGQIDALSEQAGFPFVSANLTVHETGRTWLTPSRTLRREGIRIGLTGVTRFNPMLRHRLPDGTTLVSRDPAQVLPPVVRALRDQSDVVVLLALLPIEDARQLAREVDGIDLILGAHGTTLTKEAVRERDTLILYVGDEGKYLGEVEVHHTRERGSVDLRGRTVSLYPLGPSDPLMEAHVLSVMEQAREAASLAGAVLDPGGGDGAVEQFQGAGACTACHPGIVAEWSSSRHAKAWDSLIRPDGTVRDTCVECHVTGAGQAGGFRTAEMSPHLKSVSCEACHGPSAAHVMQPNRPYGSVSLATCTSCHTSEQDPDFNYYESVPLVNHGLVPGR